MKLSNWLLIVGVICLLAGSVFAAQPEYPLYVGWASRDITPNGPVVLAGGHELIIGKIVESRLTCTALAIETRNGDKAVEQGVMVSCDLLFITRSMKSMVCEQLKKELPDFDVSKLFLNATHTHNGPVNYTPSLSSDLDPNVIKPRDYIEFLVDKVCAAVIDARKNLKPAGMSWGLGHAVVGYNRRTVYFKPVKTGYGVGTARMYGPTNIANFRCIEGYEDHGVEMLFFWDDNKKLTGILMNVCCPSQVGNGRTVSADFWDDVRREVRKRYGECLFIYPQCAAAGDISPGLRWRGKAENEMFKRRGLNQSQEIGRRLANAVDEVYPYVQKNIKNKIVFEHIVDEIKLPRYKITEAERDEAQAIWDKYHINGERYIYAKLNKRIVDRYNKQDSTPYLVMPLHVLRLGDVAMATNTFELFIDYGIRMKGRSKAVLTFVVQLADSYGRYVPTARAKAGHGYSAIALSNVVGPEGGQVLVEETVKRINGMWP